MDYSPGCPGGMKLNVNCVNPNLFRLLPYYYYLLEISGATLYQPRLGGWLVIHHAGLISIFFGGLNRIS